MSEHLERAIEVALAQIADLEQQASRHKSTVNGLCQLLSRPAMFPDADPSSRAPMRDDEFYGKPLATAVQEVLDRRKALGLGAATVADIYDTLVRGGFHFATKNAENAKRNLYTSLSKNSKFHKLPNGSYGLTEWYPNIRKGRDAEEDAADESVASAAPEDPDEKELAEAKKAFESPTEPAKKPPVSKAKSKPATAPTPSDTVETVEAAKS